MNIASIRSIRSIRSPRAARRQVESDLATAGRRIVDLEADRDRLLADLADQRIRHAQETADLRKQMADLDEEWRRYADGAEDTIHRLETYAHRLEGHAEAYAEQRDVHVTAAALVSVTRDDDESDAPEVPTLSPELDLGFTGSWSKTLTEQAFIEAELRRAEQDAILDGLLDRRESAS